MATKTAVKKVNTFEKEYHEAIKQIEQLEEKNKRLHLATDNFNKEITELEEKLTGAVEKNKDQEKTINSISNDNTEMLLKLDSEYKRNQTIKSSMDSLKNENLKLKNGILKKDYEITNVNHEHAKLVDELDELVKENNALKALVKLWS
ncbi:hypothetical protein J14TS2_44840 [Bacillus sp. J14TS2]|nr:hypothetical protein J14TS2_44840 [Bacillus sp. J14TS2]